MTDFINIKITEQFYQEKFRKFQEENEIKTNANTMNALLDKLEKLERKNEELKGKNEELKKQNEELKSLNDALKQDNQKIRLGELSLLLLGFKDPKEMDVVNDALKHSQLSLQVIAREGTLQRAKYILSATKKENFESFPEEQLKSTNKRGSAYYRINQALEAIIKHNDAQTEKAEKYCITGSLLYKLCSSNRAIIAKFMKEYKAKIDAHNKKHELIDKDNVKASRGNGEEQLKKMKQDILGISHDEQN